MRGIFCIDPGESTGVAWGVIDEQTKGAMSIDTVATRLHSGSTTITGLEPAQIRALYLLWTKFKKDCVRTYLLEPEWIDLVVEDFVLFPGEKPGRATTTPERIAWGFEGYRMAMADSYRARGRALPKHYSPIIWQKSGGAKRFTQQSIMKKAGCWVVGRQHERSAFAHMILRTNILLSWNVGSA